MKSASHLRDSFRRLLGGPLTPVTKWLLLIELAAFVVYLVLGSPPFVRDHLALTPRRAIVGLELWQVVSALLFHVHGTALIFNLIGLLALGPLIERPWGGRRFLSLFVVAGVIANLVGALVGLLYGSTQVMGGCGPSIIALIAAFGFVYRRQQLMFFGWVNTRADRLAMTLVGLALLLALLGRDIAGLMATVAAAGAAALAATSRLRLDRVGDTVVGWWHGLRRSRQRRRYQVLEGGRDGAADAVPPATSPPKDERGPDRTRYLN
jgi:membrane associated rhomboid family serine protease